MVAFLQHRTVVDPEGHLEGCSLFGRVVQVLKVYQSWFKICLVERGEVAITPLDPPWTIVDNIVDTTVEAIVFNHICGLGTVPMTRGGRDRS